MHRLPAVRKDAQLSTSNEVKSHNKAQHLTARGDGFIACCPFCVPGARCKVLYRLAASELRR